MTLRRVSEDGSEELGEAGADERRDAPTGLSGERFFKAFIARPNPQTIRLLSSGAFVAVNDAFVQLAGRERAELLGKTADRTGMWLDASPITAVLDELRNGAEVGTATVRLAADRRPIAIAMRRIDIACEAHAIAAYTDLESLAAADGGVPNSRDYSSPDEALSEDEQFYRRLVETLDVPSYTTDAEGRITAYNEPAAALWGRRPVLGRDMWCGSARMFWPDGSEIPPEHCPLGVALRENRAVRGVEIIAERPDGSRATILPFPTPLRWPDGSLRGAVNLMVDLSAQQTLRTRLEEALSVRDDFLGLTAHELRTPLTSIKGMANLLRRHGDAIQGEDRQKALLDIERGADQLDRILSNMLTLATAETGTRADVEPLLLRHLLRALVTKEQDHFPDWKISVDVPVELLPVLANASYVEQIVQNLLSNARKYSPPGSTIEMSVTRDGRQVAVEVSDHGIGIRPEEIERVFDPFVRATEAASRARGVGLGLTVCKRLIERQCGSISARPRPGGGTTFRFTLPLAEE